MTGGRRAAVAVVFFLVGAGVMTAFASPWTLLGGLVAQLAAVAVAASTILTHDMLSQRDPTHDDHA